MKDFTEDDWWVKSVSTIGRRAARYFFKRFIGSRYEIGYKWIYESPTALSWIQG